MKAIHRRAFKQIEKVIGEASEEVGRKNQIIRDLIDNKIDEIDKSNIRTSTFSSLRTLEDLSDWLEALKEDLENQ